MLWQPLRSSLRQLKEGRKQFNAKRQQTLLFKDGVCSGLGTIVVSWLDISFSFFTFENVNLSSFISLTKESD